MFETDLVKKIEPKNVQNARETNFWKSTVPLSVLTVHVYVGYYSP